MSTQQEVKERGRRTAGDDTRERLLSGLPVTERRVRVAGCPPPCWKAVSARYGWPLHVIENARDDPAIEQPEAFLQALRAALDLTEADQAVRR